MADVVITVEGIGQSRAAAAGTPLDGLVGLGPHSVILRVSGTVHGAQYVKMDLGDTLTLKDLERATVTVTAGNQ